MSTLLLIVVLGALALALAVDIGTTAAMMTRPTAWVVWRPRGRQAGISLRLPNEARGAQGHQGRGTPGWAVNPAQELADESPRPGSGSQH
jgi:hypothetical protein